MLIATTIRSQIAVIALPVALLCVAAPATAQAPTPPSTESGLFGTNRIGILWFKPSIRIPEIGTDTNVFSEAGQHAPDFVMTVLPSVDVGVRGRRFDLTVTPNAGFVYYRKSKAERSISPGINAVAERRFGSWLAINAIASSGSSRERVGFELDARARRSTRGLAVGARLSGRKTRVDVRASQSKYEYDSNARYLGVELARELNSSSRAVGVEAGYRLTPITTLVAGSDISADRFPLAPERNMDSLRTYGGIELKPRTFLSGSIRGGYRVSKPLREVMPDFAGWLARGSLGLTVRDSFSLSGAVERDLDHSFRPDRPYFIYDLYEGSVRQLLFPRLYVGAGASSTKLNYRLFGEPGSPGLTGYYEYLVNYSATVGVTLLHGTRVGVYVARWERFAGGTSSRSDRVGVQVAMGRANINDRGVFMTGPSR